MAMKQIIRQLSSPALFAIALIVAGCSAPGTTPTSVATTPDATAAPATAPTADRPAGPPAIATPMAGPEGKPSLPPMSLGQDTGRACKTNADCAVKDAGSCCGYRPVCVNKDTPTFPEKVKAACADDGRVGICGFPAIDGCQCVSGQCEGVPVLENSAPVQ